ncbi:flagellar brake protein [Dethiobacter alkaliphilus]|uniref:flagellar brake protein n=1 Tax=Dethiobacter alkaliphilus TaxID=427926 RepID=UPI002225EFF7|nr:PilZ domain-containing protein [Dethiobacter alkaliphilus]MCW3490105.1 PilZ domain-containing protein [Dethiobacter alkaliphilus]
MAITVAGAVRHKKIYPGKQVRISTAGRQEDSLGQVVDLGKDTVGLKIIAPTASLPEVWQAQDQVTVSFVVPEDAIYSFAAHVVSFEDAAMSLQVKQVTPLERREQRSDYRLKTAKLINVAVEKEVEKSGEKWQEASLLDISRGGASILSPVSVSAGTNVMVWIPLEEVDYVLETEAKVRRAVEGEEGQLIIGVSFENLPLADQEKILDYILKVYTENKDVETAK